MQECLAYFGLKVGHDVLCFGDAAKTHHSAHHSSTKAAAEAAAHHTHHHAAAHAAAHTSHTSTEAAAVVAKVAAGVVGVVDVCNDGHITFVVKLVHVQVAVVAVIVRAVDVMTYATPNVANPAIEHTLTDCEV